MTAAARINDALAGRYAVERDLLRPGGRGGRCVPSADAPCLQHVPELARRAEGARR